MAMGFNPLQMIKKRQAAATPAQPAATIAAPMTTTPQRPTDPRPAVKPLVQTPEQKASDAQSRDFAKGVNFWDKERDPRMDDVIKMRELGAQGLSDSEFNQLRDRGNQELNSSLQTGLRGLRGMQAVNGVRGGAAGAQALSLIGSINQQKADLASGLNSQDIALKRAGLDSYEKTITGENASRVGSGFGFANLGSADRTNIAQTQLGQQFLDYQKSLPQYEAAGAPGPKWYETMWNKGAGWANKIAGG